MSLQKAEDLVLKIGDGGTPEAFRVVGGLAARSIGFTAETVDGSHVASEGWRDLVPGAGLAAARIAGSGVFVSDAVARDVQAAFFAGALHQWQVLLPGLGEIAGAFRLVRLEYAGPFGREMTMSLALVSAGEITFTEES